MSINRFWHQRQIQPKRQFKFIAEIGDGKVLYSYLVRKMTRPELTMPDKQHKILGHEFHFPVGTQQWNSVNLEFMDIAGDGDDVKKENAALFLQDVVYASGYQYPSSLPNATVGITKGKAATAMGSLEVFQLDAEGRVLETFKFHNPFITKVNWGGDFDYNSDEFVMPNIDIRYDWAKIEAGSGQLYEQVGPEVVDRSTRDGLITNLRTPFGSRGTGNGPGGTY